MQSLRSCNNFFSMRQTFFKVHLFHELILFELRLFIIVISLLFVVSAVYICVALSIYVWANSTISLFSSSLILATSSAIFSSAFWEIFALVTVTVCTRQDTSLPGCLLHFRDRQSLFEI